MKESKYVTIYKEWKEKIESGQIAEGERLPTESSLMESYQVSRDTVRKSLNLLEQNGYIQRGRGRASLVMPKQRYTFPLSEIASFQEVNNNRLLIRLTRYNSEYIPEWCCRSGDR